MKRYRQYYALPGFGIDEISGLSFVREMVEWNLPPIVFESVGTPAFYLNWLRPATFVSALWTDPGNASLRKDYAEPRGAGRPAIQRAALVRHDAVGRIRGRLPESRRAGDEWMISLKIL